MKSGIISSVKMRLVSDESRPRDVVAGIFKGLKLSLNLASQTQIYLGLWERETYPAIEKAANSATWFVDVGAGAGELCCYFAKRPNVNRIYAIEPQRSELVLAKQNASLNAIPDGKIDYLQKRVSPDAADDAIKLDDLALGEGPGFIKIDVDGFEMEVLRSGPNLLARKNVTLLIETHTVLLEKECISFLQSMGYSCVIIYNAWWRSIFPEKRTIEHNRWLSAAR
ncbi:FkbM family methyltransferase [Roseiarcaceae bacterium H3SJ34-1]|uniref:FkbM family methyltransferase n=1 Tax=Terripilifer ovatus TaxID=3032367 RepID=UPI003AB96723|nr:FkbM family methyltransferase [Roseiarcaceae bacterium H3SJ34-1]